ncbi:hypothetical protein EMIHUDRAFT_59785, partial [Emiliania huxleyi CCMP1516]|uniref:Rad60/SUMO-like domain-containing protein n=2 Tax=Emiliania huxleyi TaxID=2903 RepID=A0A0D3KZN7_EMIH1
EGGDAINLKVVTQDGSEIFFKAPRTSRARPARRRRACLMNAFCQRQGMSQQGVRFLFDGERLNGNQTPAE